MDDVIYRALESQDAEEARLLLHQREVGDKLDRALAEFDRGGGIPASKVRQRLREMKVLLPSETHGAPTTRKPRDGAQCE